MGERDRPIAQIARAHDEGGAETTVLDPWTPEVQEKDGRGGR